MTYVRLSWNLFFFWGRLQNELIFETFTGGSDVTTVGTSVMTVNLTFLILRVGSTTEKGYILADIRSKGTLTKWFDDKGFGFISSEKDRKEIFIHISAFGSSLPRRPKGGDTIFFYITKDENGKTKAVDAIIEGSAPVERK
jgi:cold shock CspA family protein